MKDWLLQNIVSLMGIGCSLHVGVVGFFATWIRSKPSREEVDNRFHSVNTNIIEIRNEIVRSNELHMKTADQNGELRAILLALKESSQQEDRHLKELLGRLERTRQDHGRNGE